MWPERINFRMSLGQCVLRQPEASSGVIDYCETVFFPNSLSLCLGARLSSTAAEGFPTNMYGNGGLWNPPWDHFYSLLKILQFYFKWNAKGWGILLGLELDALQPQDNLYESHCSVQQGHSSYGFETDFRNWKMKIFHLPASAKLSPLTQNNKTTVVLLPSPVVDLWGSRWSSQSGESWGCKARLRTMDSSA